jgi:hypothetical protein
LLTLQAQALGFAGEQTQLAQLGGLALQALE